MGDPAFCGSGRLGFARQPDKDPRLHRICGNSPGQSPAARPHSRQRSFAWRQTDPCVTAGCTQACSCSNGPSGEQVSNDRTPANALEKLLRLQPSQASSNTVLRALVALQSSPLQRGHCANIDISKHACGRNLVRRKQHRTVCVQTRPGKQFDQVQLNLNPRIFLCIWQRHQPLLSKPASS